MRSTTQKQRDLHIIANELRMLCADMVQAANSGHPGAPMGLADIAIVLANHIRIFPNDEQWINRDRLVFSGGHASALLYALLHLWGYAISLHDLKNFRKLDSKTPGHPEYRHTSGVEITTGPLGQGVANAVGFALASLKAANFLGNEIINHKVYCFCGDGDLEEGISYEACSLAGVHKLANLVLIYDSNNVSIEGEVSIAFNENVRSRFESQGFFVQEINGHDYQAIDTALSQVSKEKPNLIIARTKIAKNAHSLEGSHHAHGAPLGEEIIAKTKQALGLNPETFYISNELKTHFTETINRTKFIYHAWHETLRNSDKQPLLESLLTKDFTQVIYPQFHTNTQQSFPQTATLNQQQAIATRASNGKILNAIAKAYNGFIGGSADLAPSNNTLIMESDDFPLGVNLHFGVREHAMGAICNALANYGIFTPYCATFFVFSDYLCPSIRVASLMKAQVFYIFTHDSIGVGEDGATHQPIEQLSHLRAMPNLLNWRVADANENIYAWQNALTISAPQSFILTRQNLPLIESCAITKENVARGGYIISYSSLDSRNPKLTLLASGSEVNLAIKAQEMLENPKKIDSAILQESMQALGLDSQGVATQVLSMPCFELFMAQDKHYKREIFADSKVLGIEALRALELYAFCDDVLCMESFGASGKGDLLFKKFGFSPENIALKALRILSNTFAKRKL
ncbi:transketolase [Helicobacter aurati]|uniref:Transketolase n=1 Tax=Helicobacter aurati TaxID=137778 RepID=A0A3D8J0L7_9HELI|nr:transketolase [Helicobacter aurati]RDU71038.1 transketolase [Helicobacter aurati]